MTKQKQKELKLDKQVPHQKNGQAKIRNLFRTRAKDRNVQTKNDLEY